MLCLNIEVAIEYFYSKFELTTNDIAKIFSCSRSAALLRKKEVQSKAAELEEKKRPLIFDANNVNTEFAFKVWGLSIKEMEDKYKKLQKFKKLKGSGAA